MASLLSASLFGSRDAGQRGRHPRSSGGGPRGALRAVIPEFEKRIAGSRQLNGASLVDIGMLSLAPKADIGSVDIDQHGRTVAVLSSTR